MRQIKRFFRAYFQTPPEFGVFRSEAAWWMMVVASAAFWAVVGYMNLIARGVR